MPHYLQNRRLGYVLMRKLLLENKIDLEATEDEKYDFVISIETYFINEAL
jgi:hypothetical protein